jgi:hypothetical protein
VHKKRLCRVSIHPELLMRELQLMQRQRRLVALCGGCDYVITERGSDLLFIAELLLRLCELMPQRQRFVARFVHARAFACNVLDTYQQGML